MGGLLRIPWVDEWQTKNFRGVCVCVGGGGRCRSSTLQEKGTHVPEEDNRVDDVLNRNNMRQETP